MTAADRRSRFVWCLGIFLVAAVIRISMAILLGVFQRQPGGEMFAVAQSVATEGVFGNPNFLPSGPTAFVAPMYPYILVALLKLSAGKVAFPLLVATFNILVASLLWGLLPVVSEKLAFPRRVGLLAGMMGAVNPIRHWTELNGNWEATLSGLSLMGIVALTFSCRSTWTKPSRALLLGFAWGMVALLQPAAVTVFATLLAVLSLTRPLPSGIFRGTGIALVAFILILTPWTIRNYRNFGGFMFVRSNLGTNLSMSNNDGALPSQGNQFRPQARHPHVSLVEFAKRNEMGELAYDRSRLADALAWMAAHPAPFARLTVSRFRLFWIPERSLVVFSLIEWALTTFAVIGLLSLFRSGAAARWVILGIWITYPLLYYFIQADERYRYPIEWTIVLVAAVGVWRVLDSAGFRQRAASA
jgi:hypothetical protein